MIVETNSELPGQPRRGGMIVGVAQCLIITQRAESQTKHRKDHTKHRKVAQNDVIVTQSQVKVAQNGRIATQSQRTVAQNEQTVTQSQVKVAH